MLCSSTSDEAMDRSTRYFSTLRHASSVWGLASMFIKPDARAASRLLSMCKVFTCCTFVQLCLLNRKTPHCNESKHVGA